MTSSHTLQSLSVPVRTRLRSTQILTSLPQVVSELVQNSLDASASHIDIGVNCQEWECWVKDDGHGIARTGLDALSEGNEAGRYHTSKAYNLGSLGEVCTFGFRGEALASAADISCLEIASRTAISRQTWSVIVKNGHCLYSGPAARWRMERSGTVVYLRDIFHNLPIRRSAHTRPLKTMEIICRDIETLALAFFGVSFTVSTIREPSEIGHLTDRVLHIPETTSILSAFRHIHGKALADEVDEVSVSSGATKLEGFIGLRGSRTPIYLYQPPPTFPISPSTSQYRSRLLQQQLLEENTRRSPCNLDRKPIYALSLTVPPKDIDNCTESRRSLLYVSNDDAITIFFDSVIHTFLLRHGFLVSGEVRSVPQKRRRMIAARETSGNEPDIPPSRQTSCKASTPSNQHDTVPIICEQDSLHVSPGGDNDIVWIDPSSGITFLVDKRTGHSYPRTPLSQKFDEDNTTSTRRTIAVANFVDREREPPQWILDALKDNSAYFVRERPIPSVSQRLSASEHVAPAACVTHASNCVDGSLSSIFDQTSTWCLQKDDLARMKVINQLDRKFIVCAVDEIRGRGDSSPVCDSPRNMLVLVDQHAASERVRVEGFLKTLCHNFLNLEDNGSQSADRIELDPPRPILLSRKEALILRNTQGMLGRWCFDLSWPESESHDQGVDQGAYEQFLVHSVPHVVSEKLLAGDELREFLKEYAAESETVPALGSVTHGGDRDDLTWPKALRWCPKGLLGLVNSRACRGAIMFNDPLSVEQCERLMIQLAETAFPFQCAHGRPSLVPLTGTSERPFGQGRRRSIDWRQSGSMLASLGVESSDDVGWKYTPLN